jgi:hypothetical protein
MLVPGPYDFFISWARRTTRAYTVELAKELQGEGYQTFLCEWSMDANASEADTQKGLIAALSQCKAMVLVVDSITLRAHRTGKAERLFCFGCGYAAMRGCGL